MIKQQERYNTIQLFNSIKRFIKHYAVYQTTVQHYFWQNFQISTNCDKRVSLGEAHLFSTSTYLLYHRYAKNFCSCLKYDKVLTKIILHSFL